MITEDYVSFETAKLLKEKGFHVSDISMLVGNDNHPFISGNSGYEFLLQKGQEVYPAPTLSVVMKWLREVHNLHIITLPYAPIDRHPYHPGEADVVYIAQLFRGIIPIDEIGRSVIKLTHEQACEEAIKYCLENLI